MKKSIFLSLILCLCLLTTAVLAGCNSNTEKESSSATSDEATSDEATADEASVDEAKPGGIDYMALVNKTHALPDGWEQKLQTVHMINSIKDDVEVESKAYDAYLKLKSDLEKEGVYVDLDSAYRSVAEQQRIMDDFTKQYGADYAAKTVAKPGFSEHHTGLALDLYLIIDGKDITENEDMVQYPEIWEKIHKKLDSYGFILRYLEGKEHITGYAYEPWHIRYIDNADVAGDIMSKGITFEEYLGAASSGDITVDYGSSAKYTEDDLKNAVIQAKCRFAGFDGFSLKSIRYAGDDAASDDEIAKVKAKYPKQNYTEFIELLMDFHTPENTADKAFEPNHDYTDYKWLLSKNDKGGWEIVDNGY